MTDTTFVKIFDSIETLTKWSILQLLLYFLMPYVWNYEYSTGTITSILIYSSLYTMYWKFVPKDLRAAWLFYPYLAYATIVLMLYFIFDHWSSSIWLSLSLPIYGFICWRGVQLYRNYSTKLKNKYKLGGAISYALILLVVIALKSISVSWMSNEHGLIENEKKDIIERRNYLAAKLATTPRQILNEMPPGIGVQFQGEWALYSCSMLTAALVNISHLYPESKEENLQYIDHLIRIVMSPEIRHYDTIRWDEDPLETLHGTNSHISYISHLAWMICGYKEISCDTKYDQLLASLCKAMNHRILASKGLNLPTYPNEPIYIPDMLVAIVALNKYADLHHGKYRPTVRKWINRAQKEWIDNDTGILVSFVDENGSLYENAPIKGSYAALSCYYLTLIDERFAKQQHEKVKSLFWKEGIFSGVKEYWDKTYHVGLDMDAGPIMFELSPSATAFFAGSSSYFNDSAIRNEILKTAEIAGHTIKMGDKRHYLLSHIALVGESIMLAMRTNFKRPTSTK